MQERASGWYDDPDEPSRLRYWNGSSWTERTHPKAPMPKPQPPRPPVPRLRPSREQEDGPPRESEAGAPARQDLTSADSPRPWARPDGVLRPGADIDAGRHRAHGQTRADAPDARPLASYGRRVLALLLDLLVVGVVFFAFMLMTLPFLGEVSALQQSWAQSVVRALESGRPLPDPPPAILAVSTIMLLIHAGMLVLYDTLCLHRFGATVGCLALGLRVRRAGEGGRASLGSLLWRSLVKYAGFVLGAWPATVLAGYAFAAVNFTWPATNPRRHTLHDRWSRTEVVRD